MIGKALRGRLALQMLPDIFIMQPAVRSAGHKPGNRLCHPVSHRRAVMGISDRTVAVPGHIADVQYIPA